MFQALIQLLQCDRRVPKSTALAQSESNVKLHDEATKARKYSEPSDVSTTDDASDHHDQSEDSEQTDCPTTYMRVPPGLAPPPGLDFKANAGQSHESANSILKYRLPATQADDVSLTVTCDGVVSRQPKRTTYQRAEGPAAAAAPWRTEQGTQSLHRRHQKQQADDTFVALKEALDKLAPTEIAAVRSLLDSKVRSAGAGAPSRPWNNAVGSGRTHPSRMPQDRRPDMNDVDKGESVQTFLKELALIDDARVVSVRKINVLGFGSAPLLQDYFSKFGTVDRVMVAPSVVRSESKSGRVKSESKARPAGLGFVVMQTPEEVQAILNHGETHSVAGVDIKACPFQSHGIAGTD